MHSLLKYQYTTRTSFNDIFFCRILNKSISWRPWSPTKTEVDLLLEHRRRRHVSAISSIGLRGLLNLGSTCFMNCIVQVLSVIDMFTYLEVVIKVISNYVF